MKSFKGNTLSEYGVIASLIILACLLGIMSVGNRLSEWISYTKQGMQQQVNNSVTKAAMQQQAKADFMHRKAR